jgi:succinate dehydrogenase/fumarate reductase cytochrome b subunit
MQLMNELLFSFIFRFLGVLTIGFTGVILLVLVNFLIAKLILKQGYSKELKKLTVQASMPVILVALFGVCVFFFF